MFHLSPSSKNVGGQKFYLIRRCNQPSVRGLYSSRYVFASGIQKLVYGWNKCLNEFGRYVDKININFDV